MKMIGITGRSGCGKSTVTACFRERGIPVADADQISREILLPGSELLPALARRFGEDILEPETGALRRRLLADRAFATPEGKADLDALTHPEILGRISEARQAAEAAGSPLFAVDGAVIVGTALEAECDILLVVTAPYEVSVERIARRDGISPEMARRRLDAQTPETVLTARADYVLENTGSLDSLSREADRILERLLAQAGQKGGSGRTV